MSAFSVLNVIEWLGEKAASEEVKEILRDCWKQVRVAMKEGPVK